MARQANTVSLQLPDIGVDFDPEVFDERITDEGVRLVHYRASRCPVGMTDIGSNRRSHEHHQNCSNGMVYTKAGCITGLFSQNGNSPALRDMGWVDGASAQVTFTKYYTDTREPFYVCPFDRFMLAEEHIVVPTWQLVKSHETGLDRLNFPAVKVEFLMDSRGESYDCSDFTVTAQGQIEWVGTHRPMVDLETGLGAVCSIRYVYRPHWYTARLMHELRFMQITTADGQRISEPQQKQALLQREFLYLNEEQDELSNDPRSLRQQSAPESGGFGAR